MIIGQEKRISVAQASKKLLNVFEELKLWFRKLSFFRGMLFQGNGYHFDTITFSFQQFSIVIATFQYIHLMDSDLVQFYEPLTLRHALLDENRIEVFHIRQADKFVD